jgi:hypothetical protein
VILTIVGHHLLARGERGRGRANSFDPGHIPTRDEGEVAWEGAVHVPADDLPVHRVDANSFGADEDTFRIQSALPSPQAIATARSLGPGTRFVNGNLVDEFLDSGILNLPIHDP